MSSNKWHSVIYYLYAFLFVYNQIGQIAAKSNKQAEELKKIVTQPKILSIAGAKLEECLSTIIAVAKKCK